MEVQFIESRYERKERIRNLSNLGVKELSPFRGRKPKLKVITKFPVLGKK